MLKMTSHLLGFLLLSTFTFGQIHFPKKSTFNHPLLSEMDAKIKNGDYERITSVLIAKDGEVLFEKYYNGNDQDSQHNTRSATKTMATLLTGIAIDKGFVQSEKDPIFTYLQHKLPVENPDPRKTAITIEDLLTMSSLLECNDNDDYSRGNENKMYLIEDWTKFFLDLPIRAFPFGPAPAEQPYGRSFSYCSAGSSVMAEVLENAVGTKLDAFAKKHLLQPLGITDYKLHYTPMGILNTAGGSEYKSRDFLKMIQLCVNEGKWEGEQIISANWIKKATSAKAEAFDNMDYGYLFWLLKLGEDGEVPAFAMAGNGGNKIVGIPSLGLSVVLTTTNYNNRKAHGYTGEMLTKYIVPALSGE